jgi:hypothetical protein
LESEHMNNMIIFTTKKGIQILLFYKGRNWNLFLQILTVI